MQAANGSNGAGAGAAASAGAATSTVVLFVLIALLAVLTVIGIVWGMRLKAKRVAAEKELEERAAEADGAVPTQPRQAAPPPVPVAPLTRAPRADRSDESRAPDALGNEPIAAAAPAEDHSAAIASGPASTDGPSPADGPVTHLKGLGPKVAAKLAEQGITTVGQIAALDHDEAQALDARLGAFTGRMGRDRWIEQARFLAAGDVKGFEAVFGRL